MSYKAHKTNMFYYPDGLPHPLGGKMGASNMDHITDPPLPLPKGGGSKQPTISYSSPFGGIEGATNMSHIGKIKAPPRGWGRAIGDANTYSAFAAF